MINFKKGPALSLHQVNYIGKAVSGQAVETGHVVRLVNNGGVVEVRKGSAASLPALDANYGFAINNQSAGDVIESGVIGVYALDGSSVIETDKVPSSVTLSYTNYPLGAPVTTNTSGEVVTVASLLSSENGTTLDTFKGKVIGWVEGIRTLPGKLVDVGGVQVQKEVTFLGVKLAS